MLFDNHSLPFSRSNIHSQMNRFFWDDRINIILLKYHKVKEKKRTNSHEMHAFLRRTEWILPFEWETRHGVKFPWSAAGPSPTSMYLFSVTIGELTWSLCSCLGFLQRQQLLVDGDETSRDLGLDREALKRKKKKKQWWDSNFLTWGKYKYLWLCVYKSGYLSIYLSLFCVVLNFIKFFKWQK